MLGNRITNTAIARPAKSTGSLRRLCGCARCADERGSLRLSWQRSSAVFLQDGPLASCDRNFLAGQGLVHSNRKIASQLSPVLMAIRPSSKLKGYRTGAEVDYVNLRRWFFCYTWMSSGSTFQQFNHALGIGASEPR